ncbi:MAG: pyridoxamine 5'-phosphate oxidase family protein [Microcoleus sp. PH2017_40_RAT_O_B]|uniref:pyridoxamine 5'-phosphate oxidase family protein n=1 Tax=Microcoleus sp. PH2017_40_RAT_O_B TaxID=2798850 RepID=UPI001D963C77|nr:pyridoxamine 5'-phosphate oxidase family protein [Microcoleus sp. PH2017_40_RAT_O_B]MCC3613897.1 pyridoxamine 5'-phosphate oxidase family protein [Microcoleus sp. PH2017_40_RAT_O_B]
MLDIDEMSSKEIHELLHTVGYGHLGCIHEGKPYVIPMNYYLEADDIYLFTTIGMEPLHWRSVIVNGRALRVTEQADLDRVMHLVKERNPMLSPAINRTWIDSQGRSEAIAIYRVHETEISGRTTDGVSSKKP